MVYRTNINDIKIQKKLYLLKLYMNIYIYIYWERCELKIKKCTRVPFANDKN